MKQTAADGTIYELRGNGPTVALIHGLGLNRAMWQWQIPTLESHFSVLTYDLFGHGDSAHPSATPSLTMFSEQLADLLQQCGIERCAVVGFSLGGMIARRLALDHADGLTALAILNSAHDRTPSEREAILKRVDQAHEQGPSATVEAALERWFTPGFGSARPDVMALIRRWVTANDPAVYPSIYRVLAEGDVEIADAIRKITCPTLIMTGEEDSGNSPDMARRMADVIPAARTVILPHLRHMALAEAPQQVNEPLVAFLREALAV